MGTKGRREAAAGVAAVLTVLASAACVYGPGDGDGAGAAQRAAQVTTDGTSPTPEPDVDDGIPGADALLDADQIARLDPGRRWQVTATHNNTDGDGLNTVCQQERFADPDGLAAYVRSFAAAGRPPHTAVQTVEVSQSTGQAELAFDTTVGWYAGCRVARLQLLGAFRVDGVGDEATLLTMRVWGRPVTTYSVAVARVGRVVTSTVGRNVGETLAPREQLTQSLADAVAMVCPESTVAAQPGGCSPSPSSTRVPPPPSGDEPGFLAVVDLPPVGRVREPWVGTDSAAAGGNPAATLCDQADFSTNAVRLARHRTFLIPEARLPQRFGLSETYGVFTRPRAAGAFLERMRRRLATCEDRYPGTSVVDAFHRDEEAGRSLSVWRLRSEISARAAVTFRVGFVRVGNKVAQVAFFPGPDAEMRQGAMAALMVRAGNRLTELDRVDEPPQRRGGGVDVG